MGKLLGGRYLHHTYIHSCSIYIYIHTYIHTYIHHICPQGISKLMSGTVSLDDLINAADSALIASLTAEESTVTNISPLLQAPFISNHMTNIFF